MTAGGPARVARALVAFLALAGALGRPARAEPGQAAAAAAERAFRRIASSPATYLGMQRALLLQLAHPKVSAAVAEHSAIARDPGAALDRFARTAQLGGALMFGTDREADEAAAVVNGVHDRVRGVVPGSGARYSAHDPKLQYWVMATFVDSVVTAYEHYVGPLTPAEKDAFCHEAFRRVGLRLRIPERRLPTTYGAVRGLIEHELPQLRVTDDARRLADMIVRPDLPPGLVRRLPGPGWLARLAGRAHAARAAVTRFTAAGLLPAELRDAYGLRWTASNRLLFGAAGRMSRAAGRARFARGARLRGARRGRR